MQENDFFLTKCILSPLTETEARFKNPLVLAYIGDTVYDLYIRTSLVKPSSEGINELHRKACGKVNAHSQAIAAQKVCELFTEAEADIFRRGRNSKSGIPKHADPGDYHAATGLEAVIGYLYLTGQSDRIETIFEVILHG